MLGLVFLSIKFIYNILNYTYNSKYGNKELGKHITQLFIKNIAS